MNIKPIKNEADYKSALSAVQKLWNAEPNTPEGDRLDVLVTLIEAYEAKHYRIAPPEPIEAIKFRMEQQGLKPVDLAKFLGGKNRVSEVLSGKQPLTVKMMENLHAELKIPYESLFGPIDLTKRVYSSRIIIDTNNKSGSCRETVDMMMEVA
jgi:HTH-type transcriptional regulator/antitoxin HigA